MPFLDWVSSGVSGQSSSIFSQARRLSPSMATNGTASEYGVGPVMTYQSGVSRHLFDSQSSRMTRCNRSSVYGNHAWYHGPFFLVARHQIVAEFVNEFDAIINVA